MCSNLYEIALLRNVSLCDFVPWNITRHHNALLPYSVISKMASHDDFLSKKINIMSDKPHFSLNSAVNKQLLVLQLLHQRKPSINS